MQIRRHKYFFPRTYKIVLYPLLKREQKISISGPLAILSEKKIHSLHWGAVCSLEIIKLKKKHLIIDESYILKYMLEYTRTRSQTCWTFVYIIVCLECFYINQPFFLFHLTIEKNVYITWSVMSVKMWMKPASVRWLQEYKTNIGSKVASWKCRILIKVKFDNFSWSLKSAVFYCSALFRPLVIWSLFNHCQVRVVCYYLM